MFWILYNIHERKQSYNIEEFKEPSNQVLITDLPSSNFRPGHEMTSIHTNFDNPILFN